MNCLNIIYTSDNLLLRDKLDLEYQFKLNPQRFRCFLVSLWFWTILTDCLCNLLEWNFKVGVVNYSLLLAEVDNIFSISNLHTRKVIFFERAFCDLIDFKSKISEDDTIDIIIKVLNWMFKKFLIEYEIFFVTWNVSAIIHWVPIVLEWNVTKIFPNFLK